MISSAFLRRGHLRALLHRQAVHQRSVAPWLARARPAVRAQLDRLMERFTVPWLQQAQGPARIFGWRAEGRVGEVLPLLALPARPTPEALADLADLVIALHAELASGVQSYWLKIVLDATTEERRALLGALLTAAHDLGLAPPEARRRFERHGLDAPSARALDYHRSFALRRVLTETLYGLGVAGEELLAERCRALYLRDQQALEAREQQVRARVPGYPPLELGALFAGPLWVEDVQAVLQGAGKARAAALHAYLERTTGPEAEPVRAHLDYLRALHTQAALVTEVDFSQVRRSARLPAGVWIGASPAFGDRAAGRSHVPESILEPPAKVEHPPASGERPRLKASAVFAGAGGRGPLYVASFEEILTHLEEMHGPELEVDELIGASAGAVIAGLLAAGFQPKEILEQLRAHDFSECLDDFFALGGVSPGVRGLNRNGLYSTRKMYDLVYRLLSEKLGIRGRPILFKDLPLELKLPVIVVSTDLPPELRRELGIHEDDREWELSRTRTPYFDAVAAICASGAPWPFFDAPMMQLLRKRLPADGGAPVFERYSVRLADGGTTNMRPYSMATADDAFLLTFACVNVEGPHRVTTVDLSCQDAERYIALNRRLTRERLPGAAEMMSTLAAQGYQRAILSFHMSLEPKPIGLFGRTPEESEALAAQARAHGLQPMEPAELRAEIEENRVGVNWPPLVTHALRLLPASLEPRRQHSTWQQCLSTAATAISAAKRNRRLEHNACPRR